jgi:quinone-modifying oxidoreductase subunit QmoB
MRTLGQNEYFYKSIQQDEGVFLTKGDVVSVSENGDGTLVLEANDTLLGGNIKVGVDMVVLGTGMVPVTRDEPILNLAYRQGPGFRDLDLFDGYADSNFICFPYETRRTGIYVAGCVRRALGIQECREDATGAALKAIQCLESSNRGVSVHPRSWDMTFPDFFFQRCTQCKRCTEECPFGALDDDEKGTPLPNPTRCRRCGTCMGACPERIIGFADYNIDSIGSMVKAIGVPEDDEEKLRVLVLACENDAYPALDICGLNRLSYNAHVRIIPVRCLGSVNVVWIKDALSKGIDGVLMIGCKYGDDYQCHFIKGSELANIRMDKIGEALVSLALEKERVQQVQIAIDEYEKLPGIIAEFMETIQGVGPNPFKGF